MKLRRKTIPLCLCAALLCVLIACGGQDRPPASDTDLPPVPSDILTTPEPEETPAATPEPEPAPSVTPVPENPAAAAREEKSTLELTLEGTAETVEVTLFSGTFENGPAVSLYVDESRYLWEESGDGAWLVSLPREPGNEEEAPCALELRFVPGKDADILAPALLDGYDELLSLEDMGNVAFAGRAARLMRGESARYLWSAWILDLPEGAVTLVLRYTPEMAEGHAQRLTALAETLELVSTY